MPAKSSLQILGERTFQKLFFLFAIAVSLVACGGSAPISSPLTVIPAQLDFETPINLQPTVPVTLNNSGPVSMRIDSVSVMPSNAFTILGWNGPIVLHPGRSFSLQVKFAPTTTGRYSGFIWISSSENFVRSSEVLSASAFGPTNSSKNSTLVYGNTLIALRGTATDKKDWSVSISPASASLLSGQSQQFYISGGGLAGQAFKWTAEYGSITSSGFYKAPAVSTDTQDTVTVMSGSDNKSLATAFVTIKPMTSAGVSVTLTPTSVTLPPNGLQQFTAIVSGGSSGVKWIAALGTVDASGLYRAPAQVANGTLDTVSATSVNDPSKYATSSVSIVMSSGEGPFTILSQPPITNVPYPNSLTAKQLPGAGSGGPVNHLATNSDATINAIMYAYADGDVPHGGSNDYLLSDFAQAPSNNEGGKDTIYYGQSSDPVYQVSGCSGTGSYINGKKFHAPSGAQYSGQGGGFDNKITIWDQTTNEVFAFYTNQQSASLPACSGTWSNPCTFTHSGNGYCSWGNYSTGVSYGGGGAYATNGLSPMQGNRHQEFIQGHANHAAYLNTGCEDSTTVFPANAGGYPAKLCSDLGLDPTYPVHNGSLIFADYTTAQLATLKKVLAAWQYVWVEQLTLYGGYVGDTISGGYGGLRFTRTEGSQSYLFYESHGYPGAYSGNSQYSAQTWFNWIDANCDGAFTCIKENNGLPKNVQWDLYPFSGIPKNLPGPTCSSEQAASNQCGIAKHLHIADQCVAIAQAGLSSFSSVAACP